MVLRRVNEAHRFHAVSPGYLLLGARIIKDLKRLAQPIRQFARERLVGSEKGYGYVVLRRGRHRRLELRWLGRHKVKPLFCGSPHIEAAIAGRVPIIDPD
jgi:hypothetical protein